jgi:shikimate kinase / 3-dehydroquinate synthase
VIVLVGFMGAGKTTVGHLLAERLGLPFLDSDLVIEQRTGGSIKQFFAEHGEPAFRELESRVICELVDGSEAVLALGGGAAGHPDTITALKSAQVIYLQVSYQEAMLRVAGDQYRPMLAKPGVEDLYRHRLSVYDTVATLTVATDGRRPETVSQDIIARLARVTAVPPGTSTILVSCTGGTYNVHVGQGLLTEADRLLPALPYARTAVLLASASDEPASAAVTGALRRRDLQVHRIEVPDRQADKDLATVAQVAGELADLAVHKDDLIVGIGGEAVCDIAGFVAGSYNRGMPLALVPTTLAAQADSAVGGKASLNLPQGRNLVGTVHQPIVVITDVTLASGQRSREYRAGLAEAVKHALISGGDLVPLISDHATELVNGDVDMLTEMVARSVRVKADIVGRDERERGDRLHLNYGHTFGHAIEQVSGPDLVDDGEATAVGMMAAALLARRQGRIPADLVDLHRQLLSGLGLPVAGRFDLESLREAWRRDKKYRGGTRFVVLNGLGRPEAGVPADDESLAAVMAGLSP